MAYLPGQEGGKAIADVLFGDYNPCGRLPYTYPRYSGSIWKYNHKGADAMDKEFTLKGFQPQFEFGEGLSYTSFEYSVPILSEDTISTGDSLVIKVDITNTGKIFGKEVVQLYKRDMVASVSPDIKKLVRFKKIGLEPGETKTVSFTIYTKDLAFVGTNNEWITETGEFQVLIGGTPKNLQTKNFYYR
jgi:beta-glucosidase